jgi:hypothetical protein
LNVDLRSVLHLRVADVEKIASMATVVSNALGIPFRVTVPFIVLALSFFHVVGKAKEVPLLNR